MAEPTAQLWRHMRDAIAQRYAAPVHVVACQTPLMATLPLDDIDLYCERRGEGPPLLFVKGSGATIESAALLTDAFARQFETSCSPRDSTPVDRRSSPRPGSRRT